jgi:hypothetical protein
MTRLHRFVEVFTAGLLLLSAAGCGAGAETPAELPRVEKASPSAVITMTAEPTETETPEPTATATPRPTLAPGEWKTQPVIPGVSETTREIYRAGLALGRNPQAFSKIGDCESTPSWFLGAFDKGPNDYHLGEYDSLAEVILYFQGSFARDSVAARRGFNSSSVFSPLWADPAQCRANEGPLECEYRLQNPIFAIIMLGSNDFGNPKAFEPNLRRILDYSIEQGVVPILATKADNLEKDESINETIVRLAWEYDLPLWNFWAALQGLPDAGLQPDGAHLTFASPFFENPEYMLRAWPVRNLTALQTLDSLWRGLAGNP